MSPITVMSVVLCIMFNLSFAYNFYSGYEVLAYAGPRVNSSMCYIKDLKRFLPKNATISLRRPCYKYHCDFFGIRTQCGKIPSFYPPCRVRKGEDLPYPDCCPILECPPYFKYLDAFLYLVTTLVTSGDPEWSDPNALRFKFEGKTRRGIPREVIASLLG